MNPNKNGQYEVKHPNGETWYIHESEVDNDLSIMNLMHNHFGFSEKEMKEAEIVLVHKEKITLAYEQIEAYFEPMMKGDN